MDTVITRSRWIVGILVGALCICGVRLVQLQIIEGPSLAAQGQRVRTSSTEVAAARGTITDATGVVLANSIQTYDIAVNQVNIRSFVHRDDDGNEVGDGHGHPLIFGFAVAVSFVDDDASGASDVTGFSVRLPCPPRQVHPGNVFALDGDAPAGKVDAGDVSGVARSGLDLPVDAEAVQPVVEMVCDEPFEPGSGRFCGFQVASHASSSSLSTWS